MKILVRWEKVRQLCINESYYTCGNNKQYEHMLFTLCENAETVDDVKRIAADIHEHSDLDEKLNSYGVTVEQMVGIIAEQIINECSYISLEIF